MRAKFLVLGIKLLIEDVKDQGFSYVEMSVFRCFDI